MTWRFVKYTSDKDMLLNTDLELLRKKDIVDESREGPLTACLLEFSLKSSTYATMALREILKVDTSTENQIKLAKEGGQDGETKENEKLEEAAEEPQEKKQKVDEDETVTV